VVSILKPVVMADVLGRQAFGLIAGFMAMPYMLGVALAPQASALLWLAGGYDLAILTALCIGMLALAALLLLRSGVVSNGAIGL
jgi:hypothetical protein